MVILLVLHHINSGVTDMYKIDFESVAKSMDYDLIKSAIDERQSVLKLVMSHPMPIDSDDVVTEIALLKLRIVDLVRRNKIERILCAAINYNGTIISGHRHSNCYETLKELFADPVLPEREDQGFLTSNNRFVDRMEGFKIAKKANQIIHNMFDDDEDQILTSEDLY